MKYLALMRLIRQLGWCSALVALALAGGCTALRPAAVAQPSVYTLGTVLTAAPVQAAASAPTLLVDLPRAAPGFDTAHIVYVRSPHTLEHFAHNAWVDTPARMLAPRIVAALGQGGAFRAVVLAPSAVAGSLRLDTEILRLQQDFSTSPSRTRFTLRATLVDSGTRRVLAWREFDASVAAKTDDPYGGVVAAHGAVQAVLDELAAFCASTLTDR
ncbi:cholesterol transport system auxiliary component [Rhodoferax ferrireducens]|uniref:Cholesterol transport system auxiliary component n=1 Tax=Rhodoferax ferrireducens TaxID=192843 RepID=A0ABU2C6X6_9BURK|nr:ABC-type transport auxiliary lipoprotein family protein [Rhodoferax ferrireducens]MDR7376997.1 cholesterol transport system auxiliary component [Rhodoferax ferrireducens]